MDTQRFSRIANGLKSASISSVTQTADALRREGKEVLVFSIGRPDFDTPEHIKAAANDALAKGFVHYTHNRASCPCARPWPPTSSARTGWTTIPRPKS